MVLQPESQVEEDMWNQAAADQQLRPNWIRKNLSLLEATESFRSLLTRRNLVKTDSPMYM